MKKMAFTSGMFICLFLLTGFFVKAQEEPTALMKAVYLTKDGDYNLALEYCNRAIRKNPQNAEGYYIRGFARYNLGEYNKAIKDFDTTLAINKNHADAYLYRGNCKKELNKYWPALKDYKKAKKIAPGITNMYLIKNLFTAIFS